MGNLTRASQKPLGPSPAPPSARRVELSPKTVKDTAGGPAQPYRAVDAIEADATARRHHERCGAPDRCSGLPPSIRFRAADLSRVPGAHGRGSDPPTWARKRVSEAISALGGQGSLVASCLWHVIGLEWSIRAGAGSRPVSRTRRAQAS